VQQKREAKKLAPLRQFLLLIRFCILPAAASKRKENQRRLECWPSASAVADVIMRFCDLYQVSFFWEEQMRLLVFLIISISIVGCASIKTGQLGEYHVEKTRTYNQPFEKIWVSSVDWFADHNVTIEKIEKSSGLLTARYFLKANDTYLDCGKPEATGTLGAPKIDSFGSLNVTVRSLGASETKVNVNFFGEYKLEARDAWDGHLIVGGGRCVSTGQMEREVLNYIGR